MFVYREEYYVRSRRPKEPLPDDDPKVFENWEKWKTELAPVEGLAEIMIAKHRHGATGNIDLSFQPHITRFGDLYDERKGPEVRG